MFNYMKSEDFEKNISLIASETAEGTDNSRA
jgi:hypothetical protein